MSYPVNVPYLDDRTSRGYAGITEQNLCKCILIARLCNAEVLCGRLTCRKKLVTYSLK